MRTTRIGRRWFLVLVGIGAGLFGAIGPSSRANAQTTESLAQAVVLVNSQSAEFGDFSIFIRPYLDHFGVPYTLVDLSQTPLPPNLGAYSLIIVGHEQLDPSTTYLDEAAQQRIADAVYQGTGLVNFDSDLAAGDLSPRYDYVQDIFDFAYTSAGPATDVAIASSPTPGSYVVAAQPNGATYTLDGSVTPLGVIPSPQAATLASLGGQPLLVAATHGQGRALQWTAYAWLDVAIWGPFRGWDDLIWRGFVWAARKPFVLQGMPPFVTMRVDDVSGPLGWLSIANEYGLRPWLGLFYLQIDDAEAATISQRVASGEATASIHSMSDTQYFYSYARDSVIAANFAQGTQWHLDHGIPVSRYVVPHYYDIGTNSFGGLANWGVEFVGLHTTPGTPYASPWLNLAPFREYSTGAGNSNRPVYYADFLTVPGHPEFDGTFFNCVTETRDIAYDWVPASNINLSIQRATRQIRRGLDSMTVATFFTHEYRINSQSETRWRTILQGTMNNLAPYDPIFVTQDYACQYARAMYTSRIESSVFDPSSGLVETQLFGSADLATSFYLFTGQGEDVQSVRVDVPAFTSEVTVSASVQPPAPGPTNTPGASPTNTPSPTATPSAAPTWTATPTATPTRTETPGPSATASPTRTPTSTRTATSPPSATWTRTHTPAATATATPAATLSPTATPTWTPAATLSPTATPTWTSAATLTPTAPSPSGLIFADDFETGDLSLWSSQRTDGGDLRTSAAAAAIGAQGLEALIDDGNAIYLSDERPDQEAHYRVRFYLNPASIPMADAESFLILRALHGSASAFQTNLDHAATSYRIVVAAADDAGSWRLGTPVVLGDSANLIEIEWRAASADGANDGFTTLWINGVRQVDLTGLDNDSRRVDSIRIGAVGGIDSGTRGTIFFDEFESYR